MPAELHRHPETSPPAPSARIPRVLRHVLRPLVRLMLAHGITYRPATDLLNQVYVAVATEELERDGKKPTDSRLSVMTGIHRKALRQHRIQPRREGGVPKSVALGAQLVSRWTRDARYRDAEGRPLALPRRSEDEPGAPSFDGLVRSVSSDVHPRTVLDEWLRLGVVHVDDDKTIHLVTSAFVPSQGIDEKLFHLGRNIHDHLDTTVHNLAGDGAGRLERSVHYDGLSPEDVSLLSRFAEYEGMKLLEEIDRRARKMRAEAAHMSGSEVATTSDSRHSNEHGESTEKAERMSFGLYFYRGPAGDVDSDDNINANPDGNHNSNHNDDIVDEAKRGRG